MQRKPLSYPKEIKKLFAKAKPLPKESRRKSCPHGTVPIKRTTKDDLLMARKFSNDFHKAHSNVDATAPPTNHVNKHHPCVFVEFIPQNVCKTICINCYYMFV